MPKFCVRTGSLLPLLFFNLKNCSKKHIKFTLLTTFKSTVK